MSMMWIDPPGGWRFGFPKKVDSEVPDMTQWLIDNGYPKEKITEYGDYFHVRMWDVKEQD